MKITDNLPGPPLSPPDDPPECDCAKICDNPMPYLRGKERKDGTVPCPECGGTPEHYGLGPHRHEPTGPLPDGIIGSTVMRPKEEWPPNFEEDPDAPGLGVWTCSNCEDGRVPCPCECHGGKEE